MMTFETVRDGLKDHGIAIKRTQDGEFRVNYRGGIEATAYYTDDLRDAWLTGLTMALSY